MTAVRCMVEIAREETTNSSAIPCTFVPALKAPARTLQLPREQKLVARDGDPLGRDQEGLWEVLHTTVAVPALILAERLVEPAFLHLLTTCPSCQTAWPCACFSSRKGRCPGSFGPSTHKGQAHGPRALGR